MTSPTYSYHPGHTPLLISMPHNGTVVPPEIAALMTPQGLEVPDTDWHMDRLYEFSGSLGAHCIVPFHSRYVVDLNRPPDGKPLYPGASNTELCPLTRFDNAPIYKDGVHLDAESVAHRRETYWRPYHDKLRSVLRAIQASFGVALLYEAHSIRSVVPRFFTGRLPDFNLGTAHGESCHRSLQSRLAHALSHHPEHTHVVNGRFTGGYITRRYGQPAQGVHAVQMEQAQCTYMLEEPPFSYSQKKAQRAQIVLRGLLEAMLTWAAQK